MGLNYEILLSRLPDANITGQSLRRRLSWEHNSHYHLPGSDCDYLKVTLKLRPIDPSLRGRLWEGQLRFSHSTLHTATAVCNSVPGRGRSYGMWKINWGRLHLCNSEDVVIHAGVRLFSEQLLKHPSSMLPEVSPIASLHQVLLDRIMTLVPYLGGAGVCFCHPGQVHTKTTVPGCVLILSDNCGPLALPGVS